VSVPVSVQERQEQAQQGPLQVQEQAQQVPLQAPLQEKEQVQQGPLQAPLQEKEQVQQVQEQVQQGPLQAPLQVQEQVRVQAQQGQEEEHKFHYGYLRNNMSRLYKFFFDYIPRNYMKPCPFTILCDFSPPSFLQGSKNLTPQLLTYLKRACNYKMIRSN
jgi:hypothetical protein